MAWFAEWRGVFCLALLILCYIVGFSAVVFWAVNEDPDAPDPVFLAQDLHFQLADLEINIPAVALFAVGVPPHGQSPLPKYRSHAILWGNERDFPNLEYKTALLAFAGDPERRAMVSLMRLNLGQYGTHGEWLSSREICPRLTQDWAKRACSGELRKSEPALPRSFEISVITDADWRDIRLGLPPALVLRDVDAVGDLSVFCSESVQFCRARFQVGEAVLAETFLPCGTLNEMSCQVAIMDRARALKQLITLGMSAL